MVRGNSIYVFGGVSQGGSVPYNSVVKFDMNSGQWQEMNNYGIRPLGRLFHTASLSSDGTRMIITGGIPCFSRIYERSLTFTDFNGQYPAQRNHVSTASLSVEHSLGLDDVWAYYFESGDWIQLKPPTNPHLERCHAAANVYFQEYDKNILPSSSVSVHTLSHTWGGVCALLCAQVFLVWKKAF